MTSIDELVKSSSPDKPCIETNLINLSIFDYDKFCPICICEATLGFDNYEADQNPVHLAAINGHVSAIRAFIEAGGKISSADRLVEKAASGGHTETTRFLLDNEMYYGFEIYHALVVARQSLLEYEKKSRELEVIIEMLKAETRQY
ncbi:hypothetical protein EMCG_05001 [[Emmonsia] crescens]|uniref:Uncharacterized protein n=1 Tax=[Emmonsia] crescens TaxID=73230 RepID=A0A0G2HRE2_9EURO|nr:hypothetical protein EMCG_05001 [Emmonsia crescens UAMH 3008]